MGQGSERRITRAVLAGREYLLMTVQDIDLGATEIPVAQALRRSDIQAVLAQFSAEGWELIGVYPAEDGAQLFLTRPPAV